MSADHRFPSHKEYKLDLRRQPSQVIQDHLELGGTSPQGEKIAFTNFYMTSNDVPCIPVMGEFHSSRFPRQYWKQELQKIRAGGVQIVATYLLWIHIEEEEGVFTWSGERDVRRFVELCQSLGLQVMIRIGPFAHGECRNGGLPDWLYGRPFAVRSNDERYLSFVLRYYAEIARQVEGLLFDDGGPIIGIQIENEYMHAGAPWEVTYKQGTEWVPAGSEGVEHMERLKQLALAVGLHAPIYSCTGWVGSPVPEHGFLPMQGGYAFTPWNPDPDFVQEPTHEFLFRDRHRQPLALADVTYDATRYPYASCELGGGIQITYHHRPIVPAECVQAMAITSLGSGANLLGYYMYHGGSNPIGKHAYLNEFTVPRISYDFQAPIREYGQLNESYHRLRILHLFLQDFGALLAPMEVILPENSTQVQPEDTTTLRYAARSKDGSGFLFLNNYQDHVTMQDHEGVRLRLQSKGEILSFPRMHETLTVCKDVSAILPFNLLLNDGILLKFATAQLITRLSTGDQFSYVFFVPEGMEAEFVLDRATYQAIEVTGGVLREEGEQGSVIVGPGLQSCIHITSLHGKSVQVFLLSQEQAHTCWKAPFAGQERLILSDALVVPQDDELSLSWRERETISLAFYPPLGERIVTSRGNLTEAREGYFTRYELTVPAYQLALHVEQLHAQVVSIKLPVALDAVDDAFLSIDYVGDMGHAYLDGQLVSDHFSNGLPWEIGLKRFIHPDSDRQLIIHFSPLQKGASALRYFPTGMAFRPAEDEADQVEIRSITTRPEYSSTLKLL
ncbi:MAG: beta-galactosidase [Ktedonobacteraceae bacterium]|nr:beta-galactosidase [Ktedonobacteraceae bacterium]